MDGAAGPAVKAGDQPSVLLHRSGVREAESQESTQDLSISRTTLVSIILPQTSDAI